MRLGPTTVVRLERTLTHEDSGVIFRASAVTSTSSSLITVPHRPHVVDDAVDDEDVGVSRHATHVKEDRLTGSASEGQTVAERHRHPRLGGHPEIGLIRVVNKSRVSNTDRAICVSTRRRTPKSVDKPRRPAFRTVSVAAAGKSERAVLALRSRSPRRHPPRGSPTPWFPRRLHRVSSALHSMWMTLWIVAPFSERRDAL